MRHGFLKIILVLLALALVGCGNSTQTTTVPKATDPNAPATTNDPTDPGATVKSGVPNLTGAANMQLTNIVTDASGNETYPNLEEIFGLVYGNLVGNPKLLLKLTAATSGGVTHLSGTMLFGFEDQKYWHDMTQTSFDKTGVINTSSMDIIFQDDSIVSRVTANRSGDALTNGKLLYRVRATTDVPVTYTYPGSWNTTTQGPRPTYQAASCTPFQWMCGSSACASQNDLVAPCQSYITNGNGSTKVMGSFTSTVSSWIN